MASAAQITANRINATHSTGPLDTSKTRFNGLAHGLSSKQTVIQGENQQEYDKFLRSFLTQLAPKSAVENVLAERVVAAAWRLKRFARVESAFFTNRIDAYLEANPNADPDIALANLFVDPAEQARMRLFMRYQTAVQREYDKAYKEFQTAKTERLKAEEKKTSTLSTLLAGYASLGEAPDDDSAETAPSGIGFASHERYDDNSVGSTVPHL
jgi:hypothetical protein